MSTGYQIIEQDRPHYVTLQVVKWADIFTRKNYRDIIIENHAYCQQHNYSGKKGILNIERIDRILRAYD